MYKNHSKKLKLKSKEYFQFLIGLILLIHLSACDPLRIITIENRTNSKIEINIEFKDCKNQFIQMVNYNKEFKKVILDRTREERVEVYLFGVGGWSKDEFKAFIESAESITVKEAGKPIRQIEGEELRNMLPKKRKGILFKNLMTIKILKEK